MGKPAKTKRPRGRPRKYDYDAPIRIDGSPEKIAQALLKLPADHEWEFDRKAKVKAKAEA